MKTKDLQLKFDKSIFDSGVMPKVCPICIDGAIFRLVPVNEKAKKVHKSLSPKKVFVESDIEITSTVCGG